MAARKKPSRFRAFFVSTHSRAKAAAAHTAFQIHNHVFQHTAARRRLLEWDWVDDVTATVSTHSRAKAAAYV